MFDQEIGATKVPRRIVDQQRGPECGYEAVENVIQLVHLLNNNVSERDLKVRAAHGGYARVINGMLFLDIRGYRPLLSAYRIASTWVRHEWETLTNGLRQNRVAIAVVDPHFLDPASYTAGGDLHAIVVTNFFTDLNRTILGYTGIDSNFGAKERRWKYENFEAAVARGGGWVLLTDGPIDPTHWATYEVVAYGVSGFQIVASQEP